jgi:predicted transcriptional regulator
MDERQIPFAREVVESNIASTSLTPAGAHHGNELTGRLMELKEGASNGASQKYTAAERTLDVAAATRGREIDLTRGRIVMAMMMVQSDGGARKVNKQINS